MKYEFTVILTIKEDLKKKDIKSIADTIKASIEEVNENDGFGADEEHLSATNIVVKAVKD